MQLNVECSRLAQFVSSARLVVNFEMKILSKTQKSYYKLRAIIPLYVQMKMFAQQIYYLF